MWLDENERKLLYFLKHDGLRLKKCINEPQSITELPNGQNRLRIIFPGLVTIFMKFATCILQYLLSNPVDHGPRHSITDAVDLVP